MTARVRNSTKRTKKLSAPAHEKEVEDFYAACEKVHEIPATLLRELAMAFVEHVEENGSIVKPIKFAAETDKKRR